MDYNEWDTVYNRTLTCNTINFAGLNFPYGTIEPHDEERVDRRGNSSDRWTFYVHPAKTSGIVSLHIEDQDIGTGNTLFTDYENTAEDFQAFVDNNIMGPAALIVFWIFFILIGVLLVILFCYLDNDWLNQL